MSAVIGGWGWSVWETIVGAGCAALIAKVGWVFHLGNRVTVLETNRVNDSERLERMEKKLDQLLDQRRVR